MTDRQHKAAVHRETGLRRILSVLAAFVLALGVASGAVVLDQVHEHVLEEARTAARDSAQLLDEHAKRVFRRTDYPELLTNFQAVLPVGVKGAAGMFYTDGRPLDRLAAGHGVRVLLPAGALAEALRSAPEGVIDAVSPEDGVRRLWAYRLVPELGVVAAAGVSVEDALADYRVALQVVAGAGVLGGAMILGLLLLVFRSLDNEERMIRDLEGLVEARTLEARAQADEARRANESKTRFLAAASHDLRQPLQAAGMFVEVLAARISEEKTASVVERLRQSIDATGALLNALLDISTLEEGRIRPNVRAVPVAPMLANLADQFEPEATARGLEIRVVPSGAWVRSDPVLLERALRNLMVNALRYTERGKILLGCRHRRGKVLIQVADTGIGIPPERHQAIFEDFTHFDDDRAGKRSGSLGLGLAVVRRTAALLGHLVEVRSVPGKGSVFSVEVEPARIPAP